METKNYKVALTDNEGNDIYTQTYATQVEAKMTLYAFVLNANQTLNARCASICGADIFVTPDGCMAYWERIW